MCCCLSLCLSVRLDRVPVDLVSDCELNYCQTAVSFSVAFSSGEAQLLFAKILV